MSPPNDRQVASIKIRIRILRVIASMNPISGGPCQGIRNTIPELSKLGIENEVVCLDDADADYLATDNFVIHALGQARGPWAYHKTLVPWLMDNFRKYEMVIIHGLWLYHSYAVNKVLKEYKKRNINLPKIFVMPHGMLDPYFQKAAGRKLKAIRNRIYWKLIEGQLIKNVDGVLFTCEEELLLARKTFIPYHPKKEINIGYGILPPPEYSEEMQKAFSQKVPEWNNEPYLLFLSRIHPKKGVDLLINAYQELEKEGNFLLPKLVIAGPGLEEFYGKEMQSLASTSPNIYFPGMLSGDAKWGALYGSEAFILPSHQENFGIAVVEALGCGKPVLITNKVNIYKEIKSGGGGIIESDNLKGIKTVIKSWLHLSETERDIFGKNAFQVFNKYFVVDSTAKRILDLIGFENSKYA